MIIWISWIFEHYETLNVIGLLRYQPRTLLWQGTLVWIWFMYIFNIWIWRIFGLWIDYWYISLLHYGLCLSQFGQFEYYEFVDNLRFLGSKLSIDIKACFLMAGHLGSIWFMDILNSDDIAVSLCFPFSVILLFPTRCIFSLISRFNFHTTIFLQEICFSWKLTHIWMGSKYMKTLF